MEEINHTANVILGNSDSTYDKIYYSSNEDLFQLFSRIDVDGKKVLSVLGSSDQAFHLCRKKPLSIDTFDINSLANYYYYLRKWAIIYCDQYYPDVFSSDGIRRILSFVHPKGEKETSAYSYWNEFCKTFSPFYTKKLFFMSRKPNVNKLDDLRRLKQYLVTHDLNFHHMDISSELIPSKYDLIVVSNIAEYYSFQSNKMDCFVSNLSEMLNDGGEVVTSFVMNLSETYAESCSFRNNYDKHHIYDRRGDLIGCKYKKKVLTKNS